MKIEEIKISETAVLRSYICGEYPEMPVGPRDAMLVLPGGGYVRCSEREAEPVVKKYLAAGLNVFLLYYSCGKDAAGFKPLIEASMAMKHIRDNAKEYNVNPDRVFAVGLSAGGHLAASLGTFFDDPYIKGKAGINGEENRPTGVIASYPVISGVEGAVKSCFYNILGTDKPSEEEMKRWSVELHVKENASPAFIWATANDQVVPVINSIRYAEALSRAGVPFELHIFKSGPHGISTADFEPASLDPSWGLDKTLYQNERVAKWVGISIEWLRSL